MMSSSRAFLDKHRRLTAVVLALLCNVLLLAAIGFGPSSHLLDVAAETAPDGLEPFTVTLEGHSALSSSLPPDRPPHPENPLLNQTPQAPIATSALKPATPRQSLAEALGQDPFATQTPARNPAKSPVSELWKAIEPCWLRLSDANTPSVTLEASFSPLGNLTKPPAFKMAPDSRPSAKVLHAQAQAAAALTQCAPYLSAYGQQNVVIIFPKR